MAIIQQYEIPAKEEFEIQLPVGSQILGFYELDDKPCISVLVDVAAPGREARGFVMSPIKATVDTTKVSRLVGVAVFRKGANPLHLFEKKVDAKVDV